MTRFWQNFSHYALTAQRHQAGHIGPSCHARVWGHCRRFHHPFTRAFFVRIFRQSQNVTRKSRWNDIHTKNSYVKMLMKLIPIGIECKVEKLIAPKKWHNFFCPLRARSKAYSAVHWDLIVNTVTKTPIVIHKFYGYRDPGTPSCS